VEVVDDRPSGQAATGYQRRHALVVGLNRYRAGGGPFRDLKGAGYDAEEIAAVLASRYNFEDVALVVDQEPRLRLPGVAVEVVPPSELVTARRLTECLEAMRGRVGPRDAILFFYAGHGHRLGAKGYLVPAGGRPENPATMLDLAEVARRLRGCDAHHTLMVLDCCFSGVAMEPGSGVDRAVRDAGPLEDRLLGVAERDNVDRVLNRRAFQVITAGTGREPVGDVAQLSQRYAELGRSMPEYQGHSPFTAVLLQALRGLTGLPDGRQLASDLGYYMGATLVSDERTENRQVPRYASLGGGDGDFLLDPKRKVLNPRLIAPLYLPGPQYADLREAAIRALKSDILAPGEPAQKADSGYGVERTRDLVPHLNRRLDDDQRLVRLRAGEALAELAEAYAGQVPEYSQTLAKLEAILGVVGDSQLQREAARALGHLADYAGEGSVATYKRYLERLSRVWDQEVRRTASVLGIPDENFDLPGGLRREVAGIVVPPEPSAKGPVRDWLAHLDARRRHFEALSADALRQAVVRHDQGKAFLERANRQLELGDFGHARMSAAAALAFHGVGWKEMDDTFRDQHEDLLYPGTIESGEALRLIGRCSDLRLIWCSPIISQLDAYVTSLAVSDDGTLMATADRSGTVRVWRTGTGAPCLTIEGQRYDVISLAFSPDKTTLAGGGADSLVQIWDLKSGEKRATLRGHYGGVSRLAFSPDGRFLASGSNDKSVRLWDVESLETVGTMKTGVLEHFALAFSPDGRRLAAAGGPPGRVHLWEVPSCKPLAAVNGHKFAATSLAFSPDGSTLVSGGVQDRIKVWKTPSLEPNSSFGAEDYFTLQLRYLADGVHMLSADAPIAGGSIRCWNVVMGKVVKTYRGKADGLSEAEFSRDGRSVATIYHGRTARVWDLSAGGRMDDPDEPNGAESVAFSPDARYLAAGGLGKSVRIWDVGSGTLVKTLVGHTRDVKCVTFSPDGRRLASSGSDNTVRVWDAGSGALVHTLLGHQGPSLVTSAVAYSPDGAMLASAGGDHTVRLWDATDGTPLKTLTGHTDTVAAVAFSPDGSRIASGGFDDSLHLWDAKTGKTQLLLRDHGADVLAVAFSPNGERVASGDMDGKVFVREAEGGKVLRSLTGHNRRVTALAFSPDGTRLASSSYDKTFRIWDVATGNRLAVVSEHTGVINDVAFTPDGRTLASCSDDGTLRLWAVSEREPLATMQGGLSGAVQGRAAAARLPLLGNDKGGVRAAAYSWDGRLFAVLGNDGTCQFWDVATGTLDFLLDGDKGRLTDLAFSPDHDVVAVAGKGVLEIRSTASGRLLQAIDPAVAGTLVNLAFVRSAGTLSTLNTTGDLQSWDVNTGRRLGAIKVAEKLAFFKTYRSQDGGRLACVDERNSVSLWDAAAHERLAILDGHNEERITSVDFSSDSRRVATSSDDHSVRVWDAATGRLLKVFLGHTSGVGRVRFLAGDKHLASAGWDNTVRLWDMSKDFPIKTLGGHNNGAFEMAVSPDRTLLISTTGDIEAKDWTARLQVWEASTGRLLGVLPGRNRYVSSLVFSPDGSTFVSAGDQAVELWETPSPLRMTDYLPLCKFEGLEVMWRSSAEKIGATVALGYVNLPGQSHVRILQRSPDEAQRFLRLFRQALRARDLVGAVSLIPEIVRAETFGEESERLMKEFLASEFSQLQRVLFLCTRALGSNPDNPAWLIARGTTQARLGRFDLSVSDLDKAAALNPKSPHLCYSLARGYGLCAGEFREVPASAANADRCVGAALHWLEAAVSHGYRRLSLRDFDNRDFEPVKSDPRFQQILQHNEDTPAAP